jgi:hypothetical protein
VRKFGVPGSVDDDDDDSGGIGDNEDVEDAEGGGVKGRGLREFGIADLQTA